MSEQIKRLDGTPRRVKRDLWQTRSAEKVRRGLRNEFIERLKTSRNKNVDRVRALLEKYDDVNFQSISDLRRSLQHDDEANNLLFDDDINRILIEIENDMAQVILEEEAKDQQTAEKNEAEDIVRRHLMPCTICGNVLEGETICQVCALNLGEELN